MVADGPDVITWFELHTPQADPVPVANWARWRTAGSGGCA